MVGKENFRKMNKKKENQPCMCKQMRDVFILLLIFLFFFWFCVVLCGSYFVDFILFCFVWSFFGPFFLVDLFVVLLSFMDLFWDFFLFRWRRVCVEG